MRIVLAWVGAVVVLAGAVVGGVAILNATVFSASAFVQDYLDALRAGRVTEVLDLPGVDPGALDRALLDARAREPMHATVLGSRAHGDVEEVHVAFGSGQATGETTLDVKRIGSRFGLFPRWGFAVSPITVVSIGVTGDARFQVGELPLDVAGGGPVAYAALTPGTYLVHHESRFLSSRDITVLADGRPVNIELEVRPNARFVEAAQAALEAELTACAEQPVLFPTGCPFGQATTDRVVSAPHWTISEMPTAQLVPSDSFGIWAIDRVAGVARLSVDVQSLFDGRTSTHEAEVPFEASYLIGFDGDELALTPTP
ncbi:hypothetical protein [Protaetiibacter larvae]|uniref:Uncharacterized protein n=1 Tax=Protaetiibacter larvae TaxID=2592654 RepID=A0A5C1Y6F1_9MICO|nr:hypothetical protein [Protaetiibacter larvae]QEO09008.1 hypothetical protein FLP23_02640 [Protaetiibacter larvae]